MSSQPGVPTVSPTQLDAWLRTEEPLTVLDVSDQDAFETWPVTGSAITVVQATAAKFIRAQLTGSTERYAGTLDIDRSDRVLVVSAHGETSERVAGLLVDAGFDVASLAGGLSQWADLVVTEPVPADVATVVQYRRPATGCLSYLIVDEDEAAVVDPLRAAADRYAGDALALGAALEYAVDTHIHTDHGSGARALRELSGATVVLPVGVSDRNVAFDAEYLASDGTLPLGSCELAAVALPGHTPHLTGVRIDEVLFAGDTVSPGGVPAPAPAVVDEATAAARELYTTLQEHVLSLPQTAVVCPGHYADAATAGSGPYVVSVADLPARVPALTLDESEFVDRVTGDQHSPSTATKRLIETNLGQTSPDSTELFRLEFGRAPSC